MTNYSGKQFIKIRKESGYQTRDHFYGSLKEELKKQNRSKETPSYKTIQRMETKNKFSDKTLKIICEFLSISPGDLIEKKENSQIIAKDPLSSNVMTVPFFVDSASVIKKNITKSNKRIFVQDYEVSNLSVYQDKGIAQLFHSIDNYADLKKSAYEVINSQSFGRSNNEEVNNLNITSNIEYCLKGLRSGSDWEDTNNLVPLDGNLDDFHGLEYVYNGIFKDGEGKNPLYLYCTNYSYLTYWPYPEHLYARYFKTNEEQPYLTDIYHPKKETIIINDSKDFPESEDFDPTDSNNIFRLTPVELKYSIFILSASKQIAYVWLPNLLTSKVSREVGDIVYGVPDKNEEYIFGKQFKGSYSQVLSEIQSNDLIPKNYLDSDDFKIIYGNRSAQNLLDGALKTLEDQNGEKYSTTNPMIKDDVEK
jgi:DNA-binding Xre family transcriptional regulator